MMDLIREYQYLQLLQTEYVTINDTLTTLHKHVSYLNRNNEKLTINVNALTASNIQLTADNARLTAKVDMLMEQIESLKQPIDGQIIAKIVETHLLNQLLPEKSLSGSLHDVVDFLDKVTDNTLSTKQKQKWNNIAPNIRNDIMTYYTQHEDYIDKLVDSIDVGNGVAHPTNTIVSKADLFAFYSRESPQNIVHLTNMYNYIETNNIPLPHQKA